MKKLDVESILSETDLKTKAKMMQYQAQYGLYCHLSHLSS